MKRLVEFPSVGGDPILVEVEEAGLADDRSRGMSSVRSIERASSTFQDALQQTGPVVEGLVNQLLAAEKIAGHVRPQELQLEFGIILNAEAGAILAASSSAANFKVTMTWKQSSE